MWWGQQSLNSLSWLDIFSLSKTRMVSRGFMFGLINWLYQRFTAHQHQKGHTLPKQVSPLDDDDDITESTRKKWFYSLRTALSKNCTVWEHSLSGQSVQNIRPDLIHVWKECLYAQVLPFVGIGWHCSLTCSFICSPIILCDRSSITNYSQEAAFTLQC